MIALSEDVDNSSTISDGAELSCTISRTIYAGDSPAGKQISRNGPGSPFGHQVVHKPVMWPYGKGG